MDGNGNARECKLTRCYECNRLQDELWNMAYAEVWPLVRRVLARQPSEQQGASQEKRNTIGKGVQCHGGQTQRGALRARELTAAG